jgi:branched-chain amino acid transport system permease protein
LSIVIVTGYLGQVSLAQAAFAGIAGFMVVKLTNTSVPFPFAPLLAGIIAAVLGLLVSIPALRIRGIQLAVVTMAMGVAVDAFVFRNTSFIGDLGILKFNGTDSDPSLFGGNLDPNIPPSFARPQFGLVLLAFAAACALLTVNLRRSNTGRQFLAVRVNERAAAAARVNVSQTKLIGFALSAFVAGLGGGMIAYLNGQLSPDSFGVLVSLSLLAFSYLGGIGLVSGALVAGLLAQGGLLSGILDKLVSWDGLDTYFQLIGGIGLILTAVLNPDGIAGKTARDLAAKRAEKAAVAR